MNERALKILRGGILLLVAALSVATGVALIVSCVGIYDSGPSPYSPTSVALAFGRIAPLCFVTLGVTLAAGIASLFLPQEKGKVKKHAPSQLRRERRRTGQRDEEECRKRLLLALPFLGVALASLVFVLVEFLLSGRFASIEAEALSRDMATQMLVLLPPLALSLGGGVAYHILTAASVQREIRTLSALPTVAEVPAPPSKKILIARTAILTAAFLFLLLGALNGGALDVLGKAVRICTECIGLG